MSEVKKISSSRIYTVVERALSSTSTTRALCTMIGYFGSINFYGSTCFTRGESLISTEVEAGENSRHDFNISNEFDSSLPRVRSIKFEDLKSITVSVIWRKYEKLRQL